MSYNTDKFDFQFLKGFQRLHHILFSRLSNLHKSLPTLPSLPSLNGLAIWFSTGLNETWQSTDKITLQTGAGLNDLLVIGCELDGESLAHFLDWIMPSSIKTFSSLHVAFNTIGFITRQLSSFKGLKKIEITHNQLDLVVSKNSFYLQDIYAVHMDTDAYTGYWRPPNTDLSNSRIVDIESGTFKGNYTSSYVDLYRNLLTHFEAKGLSNQCCKTCSIVEDTAHLSVFENPFDCYSDPCHLAWLLRENRHLLDKLWSAKCQDGDQHFKDINPSLFNGCPSHSFMTLD